jgi:acyl-coenzyme A synthetase/AMP-(fatty) acid ligase
VGKINKEGFIIITDRIKEMIKVKGIAVAPAELEDLLLGHPDVEDCAVLGIQDDYSGERPKAYVLVKPTVQEEAKAGRRSLEDVGKNLLQYCKENKVRYKHLVEIEFTNEIPKSPSGKILRRVLKDLERQGKRSKGVVVRDEGRASAKL